MLTFETTAVRGASDIIEKLTVCILPSCLFQADRLVQTLPFEKVVHQVTTLDAQPSNDSGGILVMVTGALLVWQAFNLLILSPIARR